MKNMKFFIFILLINNICSDTVSLLLTNKISSTPVLIKASIKL